MLLKAMNGEWQRVSFSLMLGCSLFLALLRCEAQNLVPNPGFELLDTCPYSVGFQLGDRPLNWFSWFNSPEYFNACAGSLQDIDTLVDVPSNGWTFQHAWDGQAYVGVYAYDGYAGDYREYVGAELIEPLAVGCTYGLRFRTNPAFGGSYWLDAGEGGVCNNLGLLFTMNSNAWIAPFPWPPGPAFAPRNYAHLSASTPVLDTSGWTLVEGTFLADSAYRYVVLGNFFTDALTTGYPNAGSTVDLSYYLLDGVEVFPLDPLCDGLGTDEHDPTVRPSLIMDGALLFFEWPVRRFEVSLWDGLGKRIGEPAIGVQSSATIRQPGCPGYYIARLSDGKRMFVLRFVIVE